MAFGVFGVILAVACRLAFLKILTPLRMALFINYFGVQPWCIHVSNSVKSNILTSVFGGCFNGKMKTGCTPMPTKTLIITLGPLNQFLRLTFRFVEKCLTYLKIISFEFFIRSKYFPKSKNPLIKFSIFMIFLRFRDWTIWLNL